MGEVANRLLAAANGFTVDPKNLYGTVARRYPRRTAVNIAVRMSLVWPATPITEPEYIKPQPLPAVSVFRDLMVQRIFNYIREQQLAEQFSLRA